jgi:hypothetical protein
VLDKVALEHVFLPVLRFAPVSIIPPMLHTHLHLHVPVARRKNGRSRGTLLKSNGIRAIWEQWIEKYYSFAWSLEGCGLKQALQVSTEGTTACAVT